LCPPLTFLFTEKRKGKQKKKEHENA